MVREMQHKKDATLLTLKMEGGSLKNMDKPLGAENNLPVDSQQETEDLSPTTTGSRILSTQISKKTILS